MMSLHTLFMVNNEWHGTLPTQMNLLTSLRIFRAHSNSFVGSVPNMLQNVTECIIDHENENWDGQTRVMNCPQNCCVNASNWGTDNQPFLDAYLATLTSTEMVVFPPCSTL